MIEDDPAGSLNIPSLLDSAELTVRVRTARNLTEAERLLTDDVHCILLDLALPAPARAPRRPGTAPRTSWRCCGTSCAWPRATPSSR